MFVPCAVALAAALGFTPTAGAHPLSQGSLDVVVFPDRVEVKAGVTVEEVSVTNMLALTTGTGPAAAPAGGMAGEYDKHAQYLVEHLHVAVDGRPLAGMVIRASPPAEAGTTQPGAVSTRMATYELEYRPAAPFAAEPGKIELSHNVLTDVEFLPGMKWEASYVTRVRRGDHVVAEALPLTGVKALSLDFGQTTGRGELFREYLVHGFRHIINGADSGFDHLLFISALVLASTHLWDLVKVVTAFTVAHTLTLTLAALNLFHLPERVVEPMIAASIIFVALQNIFWPKNSRGRARLAVAFFFGLFHGLGFAGGLLDAMQGMHGWTVLLAIVAFSIGVEVGHQVIVVPLFGLLKAARQARQDAAAKDRISLLAERYGSVLITVGGVFFLIFALMPGKSAG